MSRPPRRPTTLTGTPASAAWPETPWELVRRARTGEPAARRHARDTLLARYYKPVNRFFRRALRTPSDRADDVTQDFFARFMEKDALKRITHETSFRSFLKVACRRHYINWRQAERLRRARPLDESAEPLHDEDACARMLDDELRAHYLEEALAATKKCLQERGKPGVWAVFEARVRFDGAQQEGYAELAGRLGLSILEVRGRLRMARAVFRDSLVEVARQRAEDPESELRELDLLKYVE
jgi:RNA polymerase sigma factor (sigma-70 family)